MTHTHANLEVSESAYEEIKAKLKEADYGHAFVDDGAIDMQGIALIKEENKGTVVWVNSLVSHSTGKPRVEIKIGAVRTQLPADAAMDIAKHIIEVCEGAYADAFLVHFLKVELKQGPEVYGNILQQFRIYREELAREFKEEQEQA